MNENNPAHAPITVLACKAVIADPIQAVKTIHALRAEVERLQERAKAAAVALNGTLVGFDVTERTLTVRMDSKIIDGGWFIGQRAALDAAKGDKT